MGAGVQPKEALRGSSNVRSVPDTGRRVAKKLTARHGPAFLLVRTSPAGIRMKEITQAFHLWIKAIF
jgi:hypothetical protein